MLVYILNTRCRVGNRVLIFFFFRNSIRRIRSIIADFRFVPCVAEMICDFPVTLGNFERGGVASGNRDIGEVDVSPGCILSRGAPRGNFQEAPVTFVFRRYIDDKEGGERWRCWSRWVVGGGGGCFARTRRTWSRWREKSFRRIRYSSGLEIFPRIQRVY